MSPRRNKFVPGDVIRAPLVVIASVLAGEWLYYNHKPQSPQWMEHLSVIQLSNAARHGMIRRAIRNTEEELQNVG